MFSRIDLFSCRPSCWPALLLLALTFAGLSACVGTAIPVEEKNVRSMPVLGGHKVRSGETLISIAWAYGTDYRRLAELNGISAPYLIRSGQTLRLTGPPAARRAAKPAASAAPKVAKKVHKKKPLVATAVQRWQWPVRPSGAASLQVEPNRKGIDIDGRKGQAVYSAQSGTVVYAGNSISGYGNLLIIKHSAEFMSAYAYNSRVLVGEGDKVGSGQKIAEIGNTGSSREHKLHFEIRRGGNPVDPLSLLPEKPLLARG